MKSLQYKINLKSFRTTFLLLTLILLQFSPGIFASEKSEGKQKEFIKNFPLFQDNGEQDLIISVFSFLGLHDLVSISAYRNYREIIKSKGFLTASNLKISLPNDTYKAFYSLTDEDIENSVIHYENPAKKIAQLFLELRIAEILNEARKNIGQTIVIGGLITEPYEHSRVPTLADIPFMSIFRQQPLPSALNRIFLAELGNHEIRPIHRTHINLEDEIVISEIIPPYLKTVTDKFKEKLRNLFKEDVKSDGTPSDADLEEFENFAHNKVAERLKFYSVIAGNKLKQKSYYREAAILAIGLELRNSPVYTSYIEKKSLFYENISNLDKCFIELENIKETSIPSFESKKQSTLMLKKIIDKILIPN
ncbi:MAG: hypothetical protein AB8G05_20150 [Oligoflexales bacterium]